MHNLMIVARLMFVQMDVSVPLAVVFVHVAVDVDSEQSAQTDQTDSDEDEADQTFTPGRHQVDWESFPEQQGEQCEAPYSARVAQSPEKSQPPCRAPLIDRQRRDRCKVVWAGEHVRGTSPKPGQ